MASGTSSMLWDVFGAASYALAVGANGTVLAYDGVVWTPVPTPTTLPIHAVWGTAPGEAVMVGASGRILEFEGSTVSAAPFLTSANLNGVWGPSAADVLVVGDNGTTLRFEGGGWRRIPSVTSSRLLDVHGIPGGPVLAVGNAGTILRLDGDSWSPQPTPSTRNLTAVWVIAADDAFAVGDHGTILRYDGLSWQLTDSPTTVNLHGVWAASNTQVFAVGDNGTLLAFDGVRWLSGNLGSSAILKSIHSGFAVGANGTIRVNATLFREVADLRITEVDPATGDVEVTNTGPALTTGAHPFCHRLGCSSEIPAGTTFLAGEVKVLSVPGMNPKDTDLWLFRTFPFTDPNNLVHGVKYGPQAGVGQTAVAVAAGRWPSTQAFSPAAPSRTTLAYDGFGYDPKDWYIDETPTLGGPDFTPPGTVPTSLTRLSGSTEGQPPVFVLSGMEDFEDVLLGDEVTALAGWSVGNTSRTAGVFTARVVSDAAGVVAPRGISTRWLRIRDQETADERNDFYTPAIDPPGDIAGYSWTFWINIEETPGPGPQYPRFMIQHGNDGFENAWGVELRPDDVCLVVTDFGGVPSTECALGRLAPLGDWLMVAIDVDFDLGVVGLSIDDESVAVLPIELRRTAPEGGFRFSYQGSGVGNTGTTLLDDITVRVVPVERPFFAGIAARADENDVELSWRITGDDPDGGFVVYRGIDGAPQAPVAGPLPPDARRFQDADLPSGHTYGYVVAALENTEEVRSPAAVVTIERMPAVAFKSVLATLREDRVELVWDLDLNEPIAGFRIYRQGSLAAGEADMTGEALMPPETRRFEDTAIRPGHWYAHVVAAVTSDGEEIRSRQSFVAIPSPPLEIFGVFPNPFGASTRLEFSLAQRGNVTVSVYDVQGKLVTTLKEGRLREGTQSVTWNGRDANGRRVSAGAYFFKLETRGTVLTSKVVVVR
jgi:hypothetical protein